MLRPDFPRRQFLAAASLFWLMPRQAQADTTGRHPFRIIGYLPTYQFRRFDAKVASQLTDLVLFSAAPGADGELQLGKIDSAPWDELHQLHRRHDTRIILCLGGVGTSKPFSELVKSASSRSRLVKSTLACLRERKLHGVDIDWEYPRTEQDWNGLLRLLQEMKEAFTPHHLSVSVTIAPARDIPKGLSRHVDLVQLMSYDYGGKHSTRQQAEQDIDAHLRKGIPAKKLVLGMPFYGRNVTDRKAFTYAAIVARHNPSPETDLVSDIYFNNPETIRQKTQFALDVKIAGVMVWEISQDTVDERSLLRTISTTVSAHQSKAAR